MMEAGSGNDDCCGDSTDWCMLIHGGDGDDDDDDDDDDAECSDDDGGDGGDGGGDGDIHGVHHGLKEIFTAYTMI